MHKKEYLLVAFALTLATTMYFEPALAAWNDSPKGNPDSGDPLAFSFGDVKINRAYWGETSPYRLTEFDLYDDGEKVVLSRIIEEGTMTLFLDFDENGELSDGTEWLFDQNKNVYEIMSEPLIDSNQNGFFDYRDNLWNIAMIKDGNTYHHADDLGILGFNWSSAINAHGDMHGDRQYTDCLYEGVYLYPDCNVVSESHFAITSYNQNSIIFNDGKTLDSFGVVMGWLDTSEE